MKVMQFFLDIMKALILGSLAFILALTAISMLSEGLGSITGRNTYQQHQNLDKLPKLNMHDVDAPAPNGPASMIALFVKNDKDVETFQCTAFVISNKYAITAAHCLFDENLKLKTTDIFIYDLNLKRTKIVARAASIDIRADMGAILGDFSSFKKVRISTNGFLDTNGPFLTCGFPWGDKQLCSLFVPKANYYAMIQGSGNIYPGMSGGPVVDVSKGLVVGINVQVLDGRIAVVPLNGLFGALHLEVE